MVLYVDLGRAVWKRSCTPQHSTASKIGLRISNLKIKDTIMTLEPHYSTFCNGGIHYCKFKIICFLSEKVVQRCSVKKVFIEISEIHRKTPVPEPLYFYIKKESLAQVFSCEFCEISTSTFFTEHVQWLLLYFKGTAMQII